MVSTAAMRMRPQEIAEIKAAAVEIFGPDVVVRLFGSRVDDNARGGDIDLHLEVAPELDLVGKEIQFRAEIWKRLDEEQIDVVVMARGRPVRWIDAAALRNGVVL